MGSFSLSDILLAMGDATRLWRLVIFLVLSAVAVGGWFALRRNEATRRFGGAVAFGILALLINGIVPFFVPRWQRPIQGVMWLLFLFGLLRGFAVGVDLLARQRRAHFSTILRDLVTVVLYSIAVLVVSKSAFEVDITPLLATSAIVTAVIGLALQETLGNVFSGLSLQIEKPFEPGDWIRAGSHVGRVQGIGWRSTRIVTRSLELVEVPNGQLARETLTNFRGSAIGDELFIGTSYDAPPTQVKDVIRGVLQSCVHVAQIPPPVVQVVEYGDFAVKYRIRFWMIDYAIQESVRDEIMTNLWYALRRAGIEIPYPIMRLRPMEQPPTQTAAAEDRDAYTEVLRRVDFFTELSDEELSWLVASMHEAIFGRGELVCHEGDAGDTLYIVRHGRVEITTETDDGLETHIADLGPGAFFGEMSLLTGDPRSATVRAKQDTSLLILERPGFERLFRSRPAFAEALSEMVAARQTTLRERRLHTQTGDGNESKSRRLIMRMQALFRF